MENNTKAQMVLKIFIFFNEEISRNMTGNRYKDTHKINFIFHMLGLHQCETKRASFSKVIPKVFINSSGGKFLIGRAFHIERKW